MTEEEKLILESQPDVPLQVCYGIGVDSTAMLIGLYWRGIRPDVITFGNTKSEREGTYAYIPIIAEWLDRVGFPPIEICTYVPQKFMHYPTYSGLYENCLTNGTLPSLAFGGRKSCSLKWKVAPQNAFMAQWPPAIQAWEAGKKVMKVIGYDATEDHREAKLENARASGAGSTYASLEKDALLYDIRYPLREWGWDRARCKEVILAEGLPLPNKSACSFCPATKPYELHDMTRNDLLKIVTMEARAKPRLNGHKSQEQLDLEYEAAHAKWREQKQKGKEPKRYVEGEGCQGLWNRGTKGTRGGTAKPAMMSDYIREHELLPLEEIDRIEASFPLAITDRLEAFRQDLVDRGMSREDAEAQAGSWQEFLASMYDLGEASEHLCSGCSGT